jgi:tetratricopeptide (TPR) repeat protein
MKRICVFLWFLLVVVYPAVPTAGQTGPPPIPTNLLDRWADAETVQNWVRAIRAGRDALKDGRSAEAAASFRRAIEACEPKATGKIHQCIARLLLAETVLGDGFNDEALAQTDQLVVRLKKATRYTELSKVDGDPRKEEETLINSYTYQVGAALYLRSARIYLRLNLSTRAEPLFDSAARIFRQTVYKYYDYDSSELTKLYYSSGDLRLAEIYESQGRFHLISGNEKKALESLQTAQSFRKEAELYRDLSRARFAGLEKILDQLVAEPLDKSLLKRFLEDCAFYRFDDARIADLLVRQAALLKKVGRTDEATAFERFAESLRGPRMKQ